MAKIRVTPRFKAAVIASGSAVNAKSVVSVMSTAKPAIHSRMRPTGYHSIEGSEPSFTGRPSIARWPSHHAGTATLSA